MATITDDNSDLLILSDDDTNGDSLLIDSNIESLDNSTDSELISFDDDFNLESSLNETKISPNTPNLSVDTDSLFNTKDVLNEPLATVENFDFSNLDSQNTEQIQPLQPESTIEATDSLASLSNDLIMDTPIVEIEDSSVLTPIKIVTIWTMVEILDRAMHEMTSRTDVIVSEIVTEEENIKELKKQISDLESHVSISEKKVLDLNKEKTMISKNIKSLDKMKSTDVTTDNQK